MYFPVKSAASNPLFSSTDGKITILGREQALNSLKLAPSSKTLRTTLQCITFHVQTNWRVLVGEVHELEPCLNVGNRKTQQDNSFSIILYLESKRLSGPNCSGIRTEKLNAVEFTRICVLG